MNKLAIIDWGIGGVSIYKLIKQQLGEIPVTYFSDTGVTPYGKMSRRELVSRLDSVVKYLKTNGVTHIVIGCNAASTAIEHLQDQGIIVQGVIESAVATTVKLRPKNLGLIGGRRTVLSGVYRKAFADRGIKLKQRIAQPLSALIEMGDISSQTLRNESRRILAPLKTCSHILLACTHYPAASSVLKEFVSVRTVFIDPASELVNKVKRWKLVGGGEDLFLTSGDCLSMQIASENAYGIKIAQVQKIEIK